VHGSFCIETPIAFWIFWFFPAKSAFAGNASHWAGRLADRTLPAELCWREVALRNSGKQRWRIQMTTSTMTLPEGYVQSGEINLKINKRLAITLNIVALFVGILSFLLILSFAVFVRPSLLNTSGTITAGVAAVLVGLVVMLLTIHELIHGFFFWVFTRSRPVLALRLFYAYAGAPDWYIPTRQFMIVGLSPLVIIGAVGMLLMLLVPERWVLLIAILVALNSGGSTGDLLVLTRLFQLSPTSLANDTGDVVTFYEHPSTIGHL
jgi:hypothetical protein